MIKGRGNFKLRSRLTALFVFTYSICVFIYVPKAMAQSGSELYKKIENIFQVYINEEKFTYKLRPLELAMLFFGEQIAICAADPNNEIIFTHAETNQLSIEKLCFPSQPVEAYYDKFLSKFAIYKEDIEKEFDLNKFSNFFNGQIGVLKILGLNDYLAYRLDKIKSKLNSNK